MSKTNIANKLSNKQKAVTGHNFNKSVEKELIMLKNIGIIQDFKKEPKYNYPGFESYQFRPDFEIKLNDNFYIVIDNTNTIRSDRMKQKQWDAHGSKMYWKNKEINIKYFIVIPNLKQILDKESYNINLSKKLVHSTSYYSEIDDILSLKELLQYLLNYKQ